MQRVLRVSVPFVGVCFPRLTIFNYRCQKLKGPTIPFFVCSFLSFQIPHKIACHSYRQHHHDDGIGKRNICCSQRVFQIRASTYGTRPHWFFHFSPKGPRFRRQSSRCVEKIQIFFYFFLVFELNYIVGCWNFSHPLRKCTFT